VLEQLGLEVGLATIPVYGYNHTDYGHPPHNEEVSPVWVQVHAVSVPYTCRMSVYIIQLLRHYSWSKSVGKHQVNNIRLKQIKFVQDFPYLYTSHTKMAV